MSNSKIDPNNPLPLYYQVYSNLKSRIESGEFPPGEALPPERKLVEEFGVSRITIVKALDTLEGDALIERQHGRGTFVREIVPAVSVQDLTVIGYLPSGLLHPYHYAVQLGIAQITTQQHYFLQVFGLEEAAYNDVDSVLSLITGRVNGLIVYPRPDKKDLKLYRRLLELEVPFVMADRYYDEIPADYVGYEHEKASYQLTQLLIKRGHERIAIMPHFEVNASAIRERIAGYRRAMREAGLNDIDELICLDVYSRYRPYSGQKGNPAMTASLANMIDKFQPTAFVGINHDVAERLTYDLMIINAERARVAVAQNGSPNYELDIEIATFGLNPPEDYGPYTVAVAYQPGEPVGEKAAHLLIERIKEDFQGAPRLVELPIEIMKRKDEKGAE